MRSSRKARLELLVPLALAVTLLGGCGERPTTSRASGTSTPTANEAPSSGGTGSAASTEDGVDGGRQRYRTTATVLENETHGPQLCYSVADSYPPQCTGPDMVGWEWTAVDGEESVGGVTWIEQVTVTGTWDGERLTLDGPVDETPPPPPSKDPDGADPFAPGCDEPDVVDPGSGLDDMQDARNGLDHARVRSLWISGQESEWDDSIILTVVVEPGYAAEARRILREGYEGPLCVLERNLPPTSELRAAQDQVMDGSGRPIDPVFSSVPDTQRGVVEVAVMLADEQARAYALQQWGDLVELHGMLQPID